jgi:hypothetical protein
MGLATNITSDVAFGGGVMGIGYASDEAIALDLRYPNLMDVMVADGLTNTKLYSLWLNDFYSPTGSILFGGIDSEKYYGTISSMPIYPENGTYREFLVGLTSVSLTPSADLEIPMTNSSFFEKVILESSTTLIFLPPPVVEPIYQSFGVLFDSSSGIPYVNCNYGNSSTISFRFESNNVIEVPYSFIMRPWIGAPTIVVPFSNVCTLSIRSGSGDK